MVPVGGSSADDDGADFVPSPLEDGLFLIAPENDAAQRAVDGAVFDLQGLLAFGDDLITWLQSVKFRFGHFLDVQSLGLLGHTWPSFPPHC